MDQKGHGRKKVREKFGDYLMDISKYVLTAVIITTLFNDLVSNTLLVYVIGVLTMLVTLFVALFYCYK